MSRESLTSPGVAHTYTFLMNTWSTLLQSYQQRVYKSTLLTVKRQMQNAENPTPAGVISFEAACVHYSSFLDYLACEGVLEGPEIGSTDQNIPVEHPCTDNALHSRMPGGSGDYKDEGDDSAERDAIANSSW